MKVFLVKHRCFDVRIASRSGGFFVSLSDYVLKADGVVYGTILEKCREAHFSKATNKAERDLMCGSKYIQSRVGNAMIEAEQDLSSGRLVLFTGTPCQIAGFRSFLKRDYPNLITADIVCHGVPSERVWKDYLDSVEKKRGRQVVRVDFRNKYLYGWRDHIESLYFDDESRIDSRRFAGLFFDHMIIRPSCIRCPFKNLNRVSDFTFGDAWQTASLAENEKKAFADDNGVSLVLVNSEKAESLFLELGDLDVFPADINHFLQEPLKENWDPPKKRAAFWRIYQKQGFDKAEKKNNQWNRNKKILSKIRRVFQHGKAKQL